MGGGTSRFVRTTSCGWLLTSEPGGESLESEPDEPEFVLSEGVPVGFNEGNVGSAPGVPGSVTGLGGNGMSDGRDGFIPGEGGEGGS